MRSPGACVRISERPPMKALVIGAGGVGSAIANIASRRPFITQMVIADRNLSRAEAAITKVKDSRFSAAEVNAAELEDIRALIRKAKPDIVINAVDPRFVMPIFLACEIENTNYMDMAMSLSRPHPHYPNSETGVKLGDEQFARDWKPKFCSCMPQADRCTTAHGCWRTIPMRYCLNILQLLKHWHSADCNMNPWPTSWGKKSFLGLA